MLATAQKQTLLQSLGDVRVGIEHNRCAIPSRVTTKQTFFEQQQIDRS
jgi:hypothetical protein